MAAGAAKRAFSIFKMAAGATGRSAHKLKLSQVSTKFNLVKTCNIQGIGHEVFIFDNRTECGPFWLFKSQASTLCYGFFIMD